MEKTISGFVFGAILVLMQSAWAQSVVQNNVQIVDDNFTPQGIPLSVNSTVKPYGIFVNSSTFFGPAYLEIYGPNNTIQADRLITMRGPYDAGAANAGLIVSAGAHLAIYQEPFRIPLLDLASQGEAVHHIPRGGILSARPPANCPEFACSPGSLTNAAGSRGTLVVGGGGDPQFPAQQASFSTLQTLNSSVNEIRLQWFDVGNAVYIPEVGFGNEFGHSVANFYIEDGGIVDMSLLRIGVPQMEGAPNALAEGNVRMNGRSSLSACIISVGYVPTPSPTQSRYKGTLRLESRDSYIRRNPLCSQSFPNAVYVGPEGELGGIGTIQTALRNVGGFISPGNSPGTLRIEGDFTMESGLLEIEVGNDGIADKLIVTGNAVFEGGILRLKFIDGASASNGDELSFIDSNSVQGASNLTIIVEGVDGFSAEINDKGSITVMNGGTPTSEPSALEVRPGESNEINIKSQQIFPVALLTDASGPFTDPELIDLSSLRIGTPGNLSAEIVGTKTQIRDANEDGLEDLVVWFRTSDIGIGCDDSVVEITGQYLNGEQFSAIDYVIVNGCQ